MRTSEMAAPAPMSANTRRRIFGVGLISSSAIPVGQSNSGGRPGSRKELTPGAAGRTSKLIDSNPAYGDIRSLLSAGQAFFESRGASRGLGGAIDTGCAADVGYDRNGRSACRDGGDPPAATGEHTPEPGAAAGCAERG